MFTVALMSPQQLLYFDMVGVNTSSNCHVTSLKRFLTSGGKQWSGSIRTAEENGPLSERCVKGVVMVTDEVHGD